MHEFIIPDFVSLLALSLGALFILYFIGYGFLRFVFPDYIGNAFANLFAGNLLFVAVYSIIKTGGVSSSVGLVGLAVLYYFLIERRHPKTAVVWQVNKEELPIIGLLGALVYCANYFCIYNPIINKSYLLGGDYLHYARMASGLEKFSIETMDRDWFTTVGDAPVIYHFTDLWHATAFTDLFNVNSIFALSLVSWTILLVNVVLGLYLLLNILFSEYKIQIYAVAGWSLAVLLLSGISVYIDSDLKGLIGDWYDYSLFSRPKQALVVCILILAYLLIIERKVMAFSFTLMLGAMIYMPLFPVFAVAHILSLIYFKIKDKDISIFTYLIPLLYSFLFVGVFYAIFSNPDSEGGLGLGRLISDYTLPGTYLTAFNVFAGSAIKVALGVVLFLIPFIGVCIKKPHLFLKNDLVMFSIIFILASVIAYTILHPLFDAVQLWAIMYGSLMPIIATVILFYLIFLNKNKVWRVYGLLLLLATLYQNFDKKLLRGWPVSETDLQVYEEIYDMIEATGGSLDLNTVFVKDATEFSSVFSKMVDLYKPFDLLQYVDNDYNPLYISICNIRYSDSYYLVGREKKIIYTNHFQKYLCMKTEDCFRDEACKEYQDDFIRDFKIKYLITSPNAKLSHELQVMIEQSVNSQSGWGFHLLRY